MVERMINWNDKDEVNKYQRAYYQKPKVKEKRIKEIKLWKTNNPKKWKEIKKRADKKYFGNNKEKIRKQQKEYYKKNKEGIKKHNEKLEIKERRIEYAKKYNKKYFKRYNVIKRLKNNYCIDCRRLIFNQSIRCKSCKMKNKLNPNWNNGSSFEPYGLEFNEKLREQIRQRDNYRCQQCFRHQDELFTKNGRKIKLSIHHIDFNKQNNNPNNLISLCKRCHMQTNYNREDWIKYFQEKINGGLI